MKLASKLMFYCGILTFISCASAIRPSLMTAEDKQQEGKTKAVSDMTNQESIYHAKFSGAFYDKF